ncbi:MAG: sel1 repeat family protein [Dysgonamonadaceae bacterium]|jgi:hypothetical protein|nr:sel1 repeat family protein [Dysgonamonadaceae bacterium]
MMKAKLILLILFLSIGCAAPAQNTQNAQELADLKAKAEKGDSEAQFWLAWYLYENKNYAEACKWWKKAAEQGLTVAQYNMGVMYELGKGVTKNMTEAEKWYGKAAREGYKEAQERFKLLKEPAMLLGTAWSTATELLRFEEYGEFSYNKSCPNLAEAVVGTALCAGYHGIYTYDPENKTIILTYEHGYPDGVRTEIYKMNGNTLTPVSNNVTSVLSKRTPEEIAEELAKYRKEQQSYTAQYETGRTITGYRWEDALSAFGLSVVFCENGKFYFDENGDQVSGKYTYDTSTRKGQMVFDKGQSVNGNLSFHFYLDESLVIEEVEEMYGYGEFYQGGVAGEICN